MRSGIKVTSFLRNLLPSLKGNLVPVKQRHKFRAVIVQKTTMDLQHKDANKYKYPGNSYVLAPNITTRHMVILTKLRVK
jgi:hypothetical protein